jgi:hypothetical protein
MIACPMHDLANACEGLKKVQQQGRLQMMYVAVIWLAQQKIYKLLNDVQVAEQ